MKVKPRIKYKPLLPSEARIITIGKEAIAELLSENLTENVSRYFNIPMLSENSINVMYWDDKNNLLTYGVMPIQHCMEGYTLNFKRINEIYSITTESLFSGAKRKYKTIHLDADILIKK